LPPQRPPHASGICGRCRMAEPVISDVDQLLASVSGHSAKKGMLPIAEKLQRRNEALLKDAKPGDPLPLLGGIYVGIYQPCDSAGTSLGLAFNVIAAPADLGDVCGYAQTVEAVAGLSNWNGYNGENYGCEREILQALKEGKYNGGWIIPPQELLTGENM